jgi:hypothetical protein
MFGLPQHETLRMLVTINVKMLIIDEIHHVLAGPLLKQRHFLNVIKYMGNELQIPIVAAGTHDAFNAIQIDPQLANRFEPALLPRWSMNEDYLRLLASFEPTLRLGAALEPYRPGLGDQDPDPLRRHDRRDLNLVDSGSRQGDR